MVSCLCLFGCGPIDVAGGPEWVGWSASGYGRTTKTRQRHPALSNTANIFVVRNKIVMDIQQLEPYIRQILTAPGTDLSTISAKRVRKQLTEQHPSISEDFVRANKPQIDALIKSIFETVSEEIQSRQAFQQPTYDEPEPPKPVKRKHEDEDEDERDVDEDDDDYERAETTPPKSKPSKHKVSRTMTDEELARQLSTELNGRASRGATRSSNSKTNGKPKQSKSPKKSMKSAARVEDSDDDSGENFNGKRSKGKSKGGGGAKGGFGKEFILRQIICFISGNLWSLKSLII